MPTAPVPKKIDHAAIAAAKAKESHHCPHLLEEGTVKCCFCGNYFQTDPATGHGTAVPPGAIKNAIGTAAQCPARPS